MTRCTICHQEGCGEDAHGEVRTFPCWVCGVDLAHVPANTLRARFSGGPDSSDREYAHREGDPACRKEA